MAFRWQGQRSLFSATTGKRHSHANDSSHNKALTERSPLGTVHPVNTTSSEQKEPRHAEHRAVHAGGVFSTAAGGG
jgi:hypothetical protein